jgi:uncharacterized protein YeeX (DUF496 family)
VKEVVAEFLAKQEKTNPSAPTQPKLTPAQRRADLIVRLKDEIKNRQSWETVQQLVEELEKCI